MCLCVSVCRYVCATAGGYRGQKRASDLVLNSQGAVSCLMWVLRTKVGSSSKQYRFLMPESSFQLYEQAFSLINTLNEFYVCVPSLKLSFP